MPRISRPATPLSSATRLQLMWLASPALPVGGFSYSEGLEAAIESGLVNNEASVKHWLFDQLMLSLARADLHVVSKAIGAWIRGDQARIEELNHWVTRTRESSELRLQTEQMGRSLVEWLRNRGLTDPHTQACAQLSPAPTWPVAFALAVAQCFPSGAPMPDGLVKEALLSFAFGWAENMVQAAIKSVPLGQSAGQRILQHLAEQIPFAIDTACQLNDSQRQAFTPMLAILSAQHETQYSRLFRS